MSKNYYRLRNPIVQRSSESRECKNCKKVKPHKGLGLCRSCYYKYWHDGRHFDHLKYKAFKRDSYKCTRCDITLSDFLKKSGRELTIHHRDCNHDNNTFSNLVTVCNPCHRIIHWDITHAKIGDKHSRNKAYKIKYAQEYYMANKEKIKAKSNDYYQKKKQHLNLPSL